MKKLLSLAAFGLTLSAFAAQQALLDVTVTDRKSLVSQIGSFGQMIDMPQLGMMAIMGLSANPMAEEIGMMRDDGVIKATIYGDLDKLKTIVEPDAFLSDIRFVLAYPTSKSKADFLAADEDRKETDGIIKDGDDNGIVAAYSADDKWIIVGNDEAIVRQAVAAASMLPKTQKEIVRVKVTEPGMKIVAKAVEEGKTVFEAMEADDLPAFNTDMMARTVEACKSINSLTFGLRASSKGLDLTGDITVVPGSMLDRPCTKPVTSAMLGVFGKDVMMASAASADAMREDVGNSLEIYPRLLAVLKKHGFKFDYLAVEKGARHCNVTFDLPSFVGYVTTEGRATAEKIEDSEAVVKEILEAVSLKFEKNPKATEFAFGLALKGAELEKTPAERFAKALPEFKDKPVDSLGVCSLYALLKKVAEQTLAVVPATDETKMAREVVSTFPTEKDACMALASTCSGKKHSCIIRLTPAEVRGYAAVLKTLATIGESARGSMNAPLLDDEDDDDED